MFSSLQPGAHVYLHGLDFRENSAVAGGGIFFIVDVDVTPIRLVRCLICNFGRNEYDDIATQPVAVGIGWIPHEKVESGKKITKPRNSNITSEVTLPTDFVHFNVVDYFNQVLQFSTFVCFFLFCFALCWLCYTDIIFGRRIGWKTAPSALPAAI